ncbi:hypothetical protein DXG01_006826 [Tephrocybe rancida]|nr:hypothetical protein DXG01_006826 [Tephrocybe rancida]
MLATDRTTISVKVHVSRQHKLATRQLVGTVRHQFSPRFASEFSVGLIPLLMKVSGKYEANGTLLSAHIGHKLTSMTPTLNLYASRQLFHRRPEVASIELDTTEAPYAKYTFRLKLPNVFDLITAHFADDSPLPSVSGLKNLSSNTSIGIRFFSILPTLFVEQSVKFTELALKLRLTLEWSINFIGWSCGGTWAPAHRQSEVTLNLRMGLEGVTFAVAVLYEDNIFSLPVVLSAEPEPTIAFCAVLFPTTIAMLTYHFVVKSRRRNHRLQCIRAARRELLEHDGVHRDREATVNLLIGPARKSQEAESQKGGLIIMKATWGSINEDDSARDLVIDVTVPLQALVRKSQVYIPSDRNKSNIRGFGDPAPFAKKTLSVQYLFHDQPHYAEIREDFPVVLPLADHMVE